MDAEQARAHCLGKAGAWEDWPWGGGPDDGGRTIAEVGQAISSGHEHPVFKVGEGQRGKIFAFLRTAGVGVKAGRTREEADEWLARYPEDATVMAYIGRSGWNDLAFGDAIPDDEVLEAITDSYRLVVEGLPKRARPEGWDS